MNTIRTIAILSAVTTLASCQDSRPAKLGVRLTDDSGKPVAAYKVRASWCDEAATKATRNEWGIQKEVWTGKFAETDQTGLALFEMPVWTGEVSFNFIQGLAGKEDRYYLTEIPAYKFQRIENGRWIPESSVIEAVLKRKLKPIPMYARKFGMGLKTNADIPELNKEFGFDLMVSDWMPPHGKGRNADVFFTHTQKYDDPRNFVATLKVRFPGEGNGLVPAPRAPQQGSALRLDHNAPSDGYQSAFDFKTAALPPDNMIHTSVRDDMNYYVRTRTVKDAEGRIVSCNYGKIHGDFKFDVRETRRIYFTYYLNPTSNDRNVEFDPKRNLFQDLPLGEEVQDP